jgi:hypothetical protein
VLNVGRLSGGTKATVDFAKKHGRPFLVVALNNQPKVEDVLDWLKLNGIKCLNIADPRESKCPGVHQLALDFLRRLFKRPMSE